MHRTAGAHVALTTLLLMACGVDAELYDQVAGGIVIVTLINEERDNGSKRGCISGTGFVVEPHSNVVVTSAHLFFEGNDCNPATSTIAILHPANALGPICRGTLHSRGESLGDDDWALITTRCPTIDLVTNPLPVSTQRPAPGDELRMLAPVFHKDPAPGIQYSWRDRSGPTADEDRWFDEPLITAFFRPWPGSSGAPVVNATGEVVGILSGEIVVRPLSNCERIPHADITPIDVVPFERLYRERNSRNQRR